MSDWRPGVPSSAFLRLAATAWVVSAVTTLGLIFLPRVYGAVSDPVLGLERLDDPAYRTRVVVALAHPLIVLLGVIGLTLVRMRRAVGSSTVMLVGFLLWAATEGIQQSLVLVAVNWTWRPAYRAATNLAEQSALRERLASFAAVSDGLFFFLLLVFMAANLAAAAAMWHSDRLGRTVAVGFLLATGLTVVSTLTTFGNGVLPDAVMAVLYPTIQPAARLLTGIWLWRQAEEPSNFLS
ncbi:MAG TPA: hypothetical protein VMF13_14660 [Luteitalea sp.]|nr:hypothetical protein [Luteitalea sp.]